MLQLLYVECCQCMTCLRPADYIVDNWVVRIRVKKYNLIQHYGATVSQSHEKVFTPTKRYNRSCLAIIDRKCLAQLAGCMFSHALMTVGCFPLFILLLPLCLTLVVSGNVAKLVSTSKWYRTCFNKCVCCISGS